MNVIGMMLVKNEEKRWLTETLVNMREICNKIIVLDDCSDDNTVEICERLGCYVIKNNESLWSTDELKARKRLFNIVTNEFAHDGDWLLCLDADEIFVYDHLDYIKYIFHITTKQIDGIAFRLYDMW
jgi:glycosyltransferase involved in cell wall biosynthesis